MIKQMNINCSYGKVTPWNINVDIEGITVSMQLDTGASLSLTAETTFKEHWPQRSLSSSQVRLRSYSGALWVFITTYFLDLSASESCW